MCMEKINITHARTCVYNVNYHMVWSVKYRKAVLKGGIEEETKNIFGQIAADKAFTIQKYIENQKTKGESFEVEKK